MSWADAMAAHEVAVANLVRAINAVPADRWTAAPAEGKWSPAEVVVHLALTYEHLTAEQQGETSLPVRVPRWRAWMLRQLVLPRLLAGRPIPPGVRAPREIRPSGEPPTVGVAVSRLEEATRRWAAVMVRNHAAGGGRSVHPFFGALDLPTMLRFATLHTNHHRRQLERAAEGLTLHGN